MDERIRLALLGKPQISRDGVPVTGFIYNKALALLAYLAVTKRPIRARRWRACCGERCPMRPPRLISARSWLPCARLPGTKLMIDRQTVAFDPESLYWLDTEVFEAKLRGLTATSLTPADVDRTAT